MVHSTDRPFDRIKYLPVGDDKDIAQSRLEVESGSTFGETRSNRVCEVVRENTANSQSTHMNSKTRCLT